MFIPIVHERMVVSQWPWVSVAIAAACVLVFPAATWSPANDETERAFAEAVEYAVTHPETEIDRRLLTPELAVRVRDELSAELPAEASGVDGEGERASAPQAELDRLTNAWLAATERSPVWRFGLVPARLRAPALVTHQFLHGDLFHLIGNLLMFYLTAPLVEDRIGRGRFALLYLGLGVFAGAAYALHFSGLYRPLIGASGAISAVVGLFVVLYAGVKLRFLLWIGLPLGVFSAPAWAMFPVWFAMQLAFGLQASADTAAGMGGVAYWAHAWGFVGGVAAGLLLRKRSPQVEVAAPDPVPQARKLLGQGRRDEAWRLLQTSIREGDHREETIRELWQLARITGRSAEAAPAFAQLVRRALEPGDANATYRAAELWQELRSSLKKQPVDPALSLRIAEAFARLDEARDQREEIVADALSGLRPTTAPPVAAGLARLAAAAKSRDAQDALAAVRARTDLPATLVDALRG